MAKFMCKRSGNIVEFTSEYDIQEMRKHPEYEEVQDTPPPVKTTKKTKPKEN